MLTKCTQIYFFEFLQLPSIIKKEQNICYPRSFIFCGRYTGDTMRTYIE